MATDISNTLSGDDLVTIRDAVPALDLLAIRSLRRAGFTIVREAEAARKADVEPSWRLAEPEVSSAA